MAPRGRNTEPRRGGTAPSAPAPFPARDETRVATTTIGITGGIGSGKTTVCRVLEGMGARVFYADAEAKRIMHDDPAVRAEIVEAFGEASYTPDGALDRAYLAGRVFGYEAEVARLNAIVHPRVRQALVHARARAERDAVPLLVYEAALLFETGGDRHVDAVIVVDAPEDVRVDRVVARDDVAPEQVLARMGHQMKPAELRRRADYVIENTGSLERLEQQARHLFETVTATRAVR